MSREDDRKAAYEYITRRAQLFILHWSQSMDSDEKLATALAPRVEDVDTIETNIRRLRDGTADPLPELVEGFTRLFGKIISSDDIKIHLIVPFSKGE